MIPHTADFDAAYATCLARATFAALDLPADKLDEEETAVVFIFRKAIPSRARMADDALRAYRLFGGDDHQCRSEIQISGEHLHQMLAVER